MRRVMFITVQDDNKDLVVSFAVQDEHDPEEIESLTLLRTPMYESWMAPHERGVSVSLRREDNEESNCLTSLRIRDNVVKLETRHGLSVSLDISEVERQEIAAAKRVLQKMNIDGSFKQEGLGTWVDVKETTTVTETDSDMQIRTTLDFGEEGLPLEDFGALGELLAGGSPDRRETGISRKVRVGRNDPCPCGSGKKFKKCCGAR